MLEEVFSPNPYVPVADDYYLPGMFEAPNVRGAAKSTGAVQFD